jgi:hypothetical protein
MHLFEDCSEFLKKAGISRERMEHLLLTLDVLNKNTLLFAGEF